MPIHPECPNCGSQISADAPTGKCPKCLLAVGISTPTTSSEFELPDIDALNQELNDFEILELLGKGGMGAVYKGRQIKLDRIVAIKILPPEVASDPAFAARFEREAQTLAKLNHPHIVQIHDFGIEGPYYFFVMEFVEGATLRQIMQAGGLPPAEALNIIPEICSALQFAHECGIVHRDIKPENILVDQKGRVKIADFGLARLLNQELGQFTLTQTNQLLGTMHYMAPEQLKASENVDHRADIYSLGVVLYELLTGDLPIGRFEVPSQKKEVDTRFDKVVLRALDANPEQRYQHVSDIKNDVSSIAMKPQTDIESIPYGNNPYLSETEVHPKGSLQKQPSSSPRISKLALSGALWIPFFFLLLSSFFVVSTVRTSPQDRIVQRTSGYVNSTTSQSTISSNSGNSAGDLNAENEISSESSGSNQYWTPLMYISALFVLPLGITAPIGTTVFGLLAISIIRRSSGRIVGLPIAVVDALFFPLLLLDTLIFLLVYTVTALILNLLSFSSNVTGSTSLVFLVVVCFGLALSIFVDFLITRAVWRRVRH